MRRFWFVSAVVAMVAASLALADAPTTGVVTGTVTEASGAGLPGVTLELKGERGTLVEVSDSGGKFFFALVGPGAYTLTASLPGFQSAEGEVTVGAGARVQVEMQLRGAVTDEIVVTGEAPLVNKFDASSGGTVQQQELSLVVGESQVYKSVLNFLPGVVNDAGSQYYKGNNPSVAGLSGDRQGYFVDGVDVSMPRFGGGSRLEIPSSAVQEVKLEASGADAEFSRMLGGYTTVILKSGNNEYHGNLSVTLQNETWNEPWDEIEIEQVDDVQPTGDVSLGGRLVRDRLWFFAGYSTVKLINRESLASGDTLDASVDVETALAKLDWRPSDAHMLSVAWMDTPTELPFFTQAYADIYTVTNFKGGGDMLSLKWGWTVTDSLLFNANLASQNTFNDQSALYSHGIDSSAPAWSPLTNNDVYRDLASGLWYNAQANALGNGRTDFPRDQVNATLNWFTGAHDVKLGIDYQNTKWRLSTVALPVVFGRGYNPSLPGGFVTPQYRRVYKGPADVGGIEQESDATAVFVRDRITAGRRWTLNLGVRWDAQKHTNDMGEVTVDDSRFSPRLTAVYDLKGDSTILLSASAGRYVIFVPQSWSANFNRTPQARTAYDQYNWDKKKLDFVYFRTVNPVLDTGIVQVTPPWKDEYKIGLEWTFHHDWVLRTRYHYRNIDEFPQILAQAGEAGNTLVYEVTDTSGTKQNRNAVELEVQRRFKDNWTIAANYTWSDTKGNCDDTDAFACQDPYGEMRDFVDEESGLPLTVVNRYGKANQDRTHVFKIRGAYRVGLGTHHSLNFGGLYFLVSGAPWELVESVDAGGYDITHYLEPAGSRRLASQQQLNLNIDWDFDIGKSLDGQLRLEVINVLNEQEQIGVATNQRYTGEPTLSTAILQRPRSVRLIAGIKF